MRWRAYRVRAALEQLAAQSAASHFKGNGAVLQRLADSIRAAAASDDRERYAEWNLKLHRAIVEASGNGILLRTWDALDFETRARITLARPGLDLVAAAASHQAIVDALAAGNGKRAGKLLREHAESCYVQGAFAPDSRAPQTHRVASARNLTAAQTPARATR